MSMARMEVGFDDDFMMLFDKVEVVKADGGG
jgi:hypothetical protein